MVPSSVVLVGDDEPLMQLLASEALKRVGLTVIEAEDGTRWWRRIADRLSTSVGQVDDCRPVSYLQKPYSPHILLTTLQKAPPTPY